MTIQTNINGKQAKQRDFYLLASFDTLYLAVLGILPIRYNTKFSWPRISARRERPTSGFSLSKEEREVSTKGFNKSIP